MEETSKSEAEGPLGFRAVKATLVTVLFWQVISALLQNTRYEADHFKCIYEFSLPFLLLVLQFQPQKTLSYHVRKQ